MKKSTLLDLSIIAASATVFVGCQAITKKAEDKTDKKYNVILISFDDLRPELGCYGNNVIKTPNLDNFASEGVMFSHAYCQVSISAPSRASLMTGLRPDSTRVWHLADKFRETIPNVTTLPQYFHNYGYHTVAIGKQFHNHMPDSISFDEPDLRPDEYKTADMIDRDAESFYYDDDIKKELAKVREERLRKNPNAYADGWAYGRVMEDSDAPDSAFYDGAQTDLALEVLKRLKDQDQPFFLSLGYFRPHLPFVAPRKYWDLYNRDSIPMATNPYLPINSPIMAINSTYELTGCYDMYANHPSVYQQPEDTARMLKHGYYASVSYVDACFGKLMEGLKEMGLDKNTIILIYGDHGWKLGEHRSWCKQTVYENDTHVPLIINAPDIKAKGQKCDRLVELVDIFPTLSDLAGIQPPQYLQGTSMKPLLENPTQPWKAAAFSQHHRRPKESPDNQRYMGYSIRTENFHYVEWYFWDNDNKIKGDYVTCELYDSTNDPDENTNVADEYANTEIIKGLSTQLHNGWRNALP